MAAAPDLNIDYIAELARLRLSSAEKERFARQLGDVLGYIEKLQQVDVSAVEPTAHAFPLTNVWQEDRSQPGFPPEVIAKMAPAARHNLVVVPRVVEDPG